MNIFPNFIIHLSEDSIWREAKYFSVSYTSFPAVLGRHLIRYNIGLIIFSPFKERHDVENLTIFGSKDPEDDGRASAVSGTSLTVRGIHPEHPVARLVITRDKTPPPPNSTLHRDHNAPKPSQRVRRFLLSDIICSTARYAHIRYVHVGTTTPVQQVVYRRRFSRRQVRKYNISVEWSDIMAHVIIATI